MTMDARILHARSGVTLEQTIGEPASAGAEVGTDRACNLDTERLDRAFELISSSAHEPRARPHLQQVGR